MVHNTEIEAYQIVKEKKKYVELAMSEDIREQVNKMNKSKDMYKVLSESIAPEIYGMEDVKKALLLLMVGGAT